MVTSIRKQISNTAEASRLVSWTTCTHKGIGEHGDYDTASWCLRLHCEELIHADRECKEEDLRVMLTPLNSQSNGALSLTFLAGRLRTIPVAGSLLSIKRHWVLQEELTPAVTAL